MEAMRIVKLFDRVSVDGHPGSAVAFFYTRRERSALARFDDMQVRELPESRVTVGTTPARSSRCSGDRMIARAGTTGDAKALGLRRD
jgi:hypothetical protein